MCGQREVLVGGGGSVVYPREHFIFPTLSPQKGQQNYEKNVFFHQNIEIFLFFPRYFNERFLRLVHNYRHFLTTTNPDILAGLEPPTHNFSPQSCSVLTMNWILNPRKWLSTFSKGCKPESHQQFQKKIDFILMPTRLSTSSHSRNFLSSFCLSVCLSVFLHLSKNLFCISFCPKVFFFHFISVFLSYFLSVLLSICLFFFHSIFLSIFLGKWSETRINAKKTQNVDLIIFCWMLRWIFEMLMFFEVSS